MTFIQVSEKLFIAHQVFPSEAAAIANELSALPEREWESRGDPGLYKAGPFTHEDGRLYREEAGPIDNLPALAAITLSSLFRHRKRILVNRQLPGSIQGLHPDGGQQAPIDVLHASPQGNFDYRPRSSRVIEELDVTTGDVVRINSCMLMHRGRNPSSATRYTVVFYNKGIDDPPKVEEWLVA